MARAHEAQPKLSPHWIWVTDADSYEPLEEDVAHLLSQSGSKRSNIFYQKVRSTLDSGEDGWWTCSRHTRAGDLALLYCKSPRKHFGFLMQAMSDAFSLYGDPSVDNPSWDFGCRWRVLYPFVRPVSLDDLRSHPQLRNWPPLRRNFIGKAHAVREDDWADLWDLLRTKEGPEFDRWSRPEPLAIPPEYQTERQIEDRLIAEWHRIARTAPGLRFEQRQVLCRGFGRLDILAVDERANEWVVIELKATRADMGVADQLLNYMSWVSEKMARRNAVKGIVVAAGCDPRLKTKLDFLGNATFVDLADLGLSPGTEQSRTSQVR